MDKKIKAIIWDMGGVLLRTENKQPRLELANMLGISYEMLDQVVFASESAHSAERGEIADSAHWEYVAKTLHIATDELTSFQESFWSGDEVDQKLVSVIQKLKSTYAMGLLSNAWIDSRKVISQRFPGFLDVFDVSIFSAEVGLRKPDAQFFNWLLEKMKVKVNQAIFIDDFIENISAANALGLKTVHFKTANQTQSELELLLRDDTNG